MSEKGCGRVALLSGRTITLAMGVPACPREHHGALGARVSRILSRLRCSDHLTAILIGVGSGVFIIAAGRIFRQIIVVHTASAANRRLVSTADSRYLALILVRLVCTGHDANTLYCTRFLPWSAERNDLLPDLVSIRMHFCQVNLWLFWDVPGALEWNAACPLDCGVPTSQV